MPVGIRSERLKSDIMERILTSCSHENRHCGVKEFQVKLAFLMRQLVKLAFIRNHQRCLAELVNAFLFYFQVLFAPFMFCSQLYIPLVLNSDFRLN